LSQKAASDNHDFLWPLIAGWQLTNMRRYTAAIESFNEAATRDGTQVRTFCGAGLAYLQAGMAAQSLGSGVTAVQVPPGMTAEALFREAERCYAKALRMTTDKSEVEQLHEAAKAAEKAIATTVKRSQS
jgi:tetratricopeptide (TPR) repeat protein